MDSRSHRLFTASESNRNILVLRSQSQYAMTIFILPCHTDTHPSGNISFDLAAVGDQDGLISDSTFHDVQNVCSVQVVSIAFSVEGFVGNKVGRWVDSSQMYNYIMFERLLKDNGAY